MSTKAINTYQTRRESILIAVCKAVSLGIDASDTDYRYDDDQINDIIEESCEAAFAAIDILLVDLIKTVEIEVTSNE